jgi:hypothetical protein
MPHRICLIRITKFSFQDFGVLFLGELKSRFLAKLLPRRFRISGTLLYLLKLLARAFVMHVV